jgi:Protein of unknown function (DUF1460).
MKKFLLLLCTIAFCICCNGGQAPQGDLSDVRYTQKDVNEFNRIMEYLGDVKDVPMSELVMRIAKFKLGTPYVSNTLEKDPEMLTVNICETDCILFVEMCLALAQTAKEDEPTFEKFCRNIQALRYRDGKVDGYASRNHYTSGWIQQGEERGIMHEITQEIGGEPYDQKFFFMSTHPDSYRQIKEDPSLVEGIKAMEEELNGHDYYLIAKSDISKFADQIKDGDIICFNCSTPGLDIAHVSYAIWQNDELTFLHASYGQKKVVINEKPLVPYTNGISSHNGIRVVRLCD